MAKEKVSLTDRVLKGASAIQKNSYMTAISYGLASLMPIIVVGSMMTILTTLAVAIKVPAFQQVLTATGIKPFLKYPNMVTNGLLGIFAAYAIGYNLAQIKKQDPYSAGLLSIMAFMIVQPFGVVKGQDVLPLNLVGAEGIFTAIIIGLIVPNIMKLMADHNLLIKMPQGVPEMISRSFAALTAAFAVLIIFFTIKIIFANTSVGTLQNLIKIVIQTPLKALGASWISFVIVVLASNLLWFFGVHGNLVLSVMMPIYLQLDLENLSAYQAGKPLPNIIGNAYLNAYASGSCILFGLVFWLWRARSKRYQVIAKLGAVPLFFGISEPLAFGVPYVLNFTLFIPQVFSASLNAALAYFATIIGILPRLNGANVFGVPIPFNGFLVGGWRVMLFQVFLCLLNVLIWAPFVKRLDRDEYTRELASAAKG
ncbi:PTS sugar transporter subunit IIC [Schleiferilactobacillus harbinensis]|uniref:Permease IIC component n=1 Tax=Schleiferilactobacillus harbinensis TaxID=304207 RepID=A0ABU7SZ22_9LACO